MRGLQREPRAPVVEGQGLSQRRPPFGGMARGALPRHLAVRAAGDGSGRGLGHSRRGNPLPLEPEMTDSRS